MHGQLSCGLTMQALPPFPDVAGGAHMAYCRLLASDAQQVVLTQ